MRFLSPKDAAANEPTQATGLSIDEIEKLIDERATSIVDARMAVELPLVQAAAVAEAWRALPKWLTMHRWDQKQFVRMIADKYLAQYTAHLDDNYQPAFFLDGRAVPLPYGAFAQERTLAQSYLAKDPFEAALSNARGIPDGLLGTGEAGAEFRIAVAEALIRRDAAQ